MARAVEPAGGGSRASGRYAAAQTVLLFAYAGAYFLDPGPPIVPAGGIAGRLGTLLALGGLLVMFLAFRALGRAIQVAPEPRPDAQLVTRGIYERLRHPIYTGIVIIVVGLFLRKATPLVGIGTAVVIAFLVVKVRIEEKLLLARYPEYAAYKARTWGVLPGLI
jgi:protein-S-isoprenylcysteine O-methyltransferase Ste14